jgi:DNA-binding response OmpR family regulator
LKATHGLGFRNLKMKNILLVEDDANTARAVVARLTADGHQVCAVRSAWDAIHAVKQERFHLFLLDIGLPDSNGLSLAVELLASPGAQATPIVFLTGNGDLTARLNASKLGVCGWVDKPYQPDDLRSVIAIALRESNFGVENQHQLSPLKSLFLNFGDSRTITVLVIEDDKRLALAMQRRLEIAGYSAITAHSGLAGLDAALESRPSLILSDIYMPGGLGFTIFEHLAERGLNDIPVIFITASKRPNLRQTAFQMGAADFMEKPYDPAELLRSVRRAIFVHN